MLSFHWRQRRFQLSSILDFQLLTHKNNIISCATQITPKYLRWLYWRLWVLIDNVIKQETHTHTHRSNIVGRVRIGTGHSRMSFMCANDKNWCHCSSARKLVDIYIRRTEFMFESIVLTMSQRWAFMLLVFFSVLFCFNQSILSHRN